MRQTIIHRSTQPFRVFALPLARFPKPQPTSTTTPTSESSNTSAPKPPTPLILFHISQPEISPSETKPPLYERALQKASQQWLKLSEKDKNSWMYWFWSKGEGLMDKIEFEEWALKSIIEGQGVKIAKEGEQQQRIEIPLLYPTLKDKPLPPLLPKLHRHLLHRIPYHRKKMIQALIASPLTAPFALIPIIPNFPLFYVLWRAWSHYKAWRGATYLEQLINLRMIVEKPSPDLDIVYTSSLNQGSKDGLKGNGEKMELTQEKITQVVKNEKGEEMPLQAIGKGSAPDGTSTPDSLIYDSNSNSEKRVSPLKKIDKPKHPSLLLSITQLPLLQKTFGLRPSEIVDINRAVEQADLRLKQADAKIKESEASQKPPSDNAGKAGAEKKGTKWRGNLHR